MHTLLFLGSYIYRETVMQMTTRAYAVVFWMKSDYFYYVHVLKPEQPLEEPLFRYNPILEQINGFFIP